MLMDQGAVEVTRDKGDVFASLIIQSDKTRLKVVFFISPPCFSLQPKNIDLLMSVKNLHL